MDASLFIAGKISFRDRTAMICIAVSFLVIILAVAISSGFRQAIGDGLSAVSGDVLVSPSDMNLFNEDHPMRSDAGYVEHVAGLECVESLVPVVWRAGIVKSSEGMHGILLKGLPGGVQDDSLSLSVSVPRRFADMAGLEPGDRMLTYFVGETVKARQFNVTSVHDVVAQTDDRFIVYASMTDLQRLNGWERNQVSAIEVHLADDETIRDAAEEIGTVVGAYHSEDDRDVVVTSVTSRFPQLFDWLELIDFNVLLILVLMIIVAGFNMISGLLIVLFEKISAIGLLKSLGMTDRAVSKAFLAASAAVVLKGMAAGNIIAMLLCFIQDRTHLMGLNPENYYVSYVPVDLDLGTVLITDAAAFLAIMLLLFIPCIFISRVDPADTVRVR